MCKSNQQLHHQRRGNTQTAKVLWTSVCQKPNQTAKDQLLCVGNPCLSNQISEVDM